ncbi:CPCC family cysteine-rich protein [Streptomyces sp. NPDC002962]|uniref:CPCC family cysteine-rich protein n=1 Tax=Streptomyces sp. NPDC002962 TaxID=3364674 RepID=UPI0036AEB227
MRLPLRDDADDQPRTSTDVCGPSAQVKAHQPKAEPLPKLLRDEEARIYWVAAGDAAGQDAMVVTHTHGKAEAGSCRCPCCGFLTLDQRAGFEICPVCFWEDDGQDDDDADRVRGGPNGRLSLTEARRNFRVLGASDGRRAKFVRAPLPTEYPTA